MIEEFLKSLARNAAIVVTVLTITLIVGGGAWFAWKRRAHVDHLRRKLRGEIAIPSRLREMLSKTFNTDTVEMGALGAVTLVDLAWAYSLTDPAIWDHFSGASAEKMADALQNMDVLKSALGDHTIPFIDGLLESLRGVEAATVFHDMLDGLPILADASVVAIDAKSSAVVDWLAVTVDAKSSGAEGILNVHIPLVTIGFASWRAWRRAQGGTGIKRNVEFAAVEVASRTGGGLLGGKVGGTLGTVIVPGVGTLIGTLAGVVAGAVGGALAGEAVKKRHVERASRELDERLTALGAHYLEDSVNFQQVTEVFRQHEQDYVSSLQETKQRLRRYAKPWRLIWPDENLILLQETVRLAEDRLGTVRQGTAEAIDRLTFMRESRQQRQFGVMLLGNPALCAEVPCQGELIRPAREANRQLIAEMRELGMVDG